MSVTSVCQLTVFIIVAGLFLTTRVAYSQSDWPRISNSADGTPISYEVYGEGDTTLVFVHGWSCDSRYWQKQLPVFSKQYQVVLIDLAGHGHSGMSRDRYSMKAFGEDVKAVVDATKAKTVILIGHSMGGTVIAEAALLMPQRVIGIIGVDTYQNIGYKMNQQAFDGMMLPFGQDFQAGTQQFVQHMLRPETDAMLRQWIIADMASAPSSVGISAMEEYMGKFLNEEMVPLFGRISVPVVAVYGDLWPIDVDENRKHIQSFEAFVIENTDHFLMLNRQDEFNKTLKQAIRSI